MQINIETRDNCKTFKFIMMDSNIETGRGYLYVITNDSQNEKYGLMADVKVDENYQKSGIGTKIVKEIIQKAKQEKCLWLLGTSRYSRAHVHKWYKKIGFEDYGKEFRIVFS